MNEPPSPEGSIVPPNDNILTFPNGQPIPPSPGEGMRQQKELVAGIKEEAVAQLAQSADRIITAGELNELDQKRKTLFRAFELTKKQLEQDASCLEAAAMTLDITVSENLMKCYQLMDNALHLRITTHWLDSLMMPEPAARPPQAG